MYEGKLIFRQNASFYNGANPSGCYGVPYFEDSMKVTNPYSVDAHATFWLRSSNILILPICTPPKSIYFSFISYIMERYNDYQNNTVIPGRKQLYASLGAALNNLVWNTQSNDIENNYNSLSTILATGDNKTFNEIYNLLTNNNIYNLTSNEINLETLPNEYIKFLPYKYNNLNIEEYNKSYDVGTFILRVTLTLNETEYQQYIHTNQSIFLLEPKHINPNDNIPKEPFQAFVRETYSDQNMNEAKIYNGILNEYENDLIKYFKDTYNYKFVRDLVFPNIQYNRNVTDFNLTTYGFACIDLNENCGGDNRDAQYYEMLRSSNLTLNDSKTFYIILGVMHSNPDIKQTIYSNIVYEDSTLNRDHSSNPFITMFEYNGSGLILPVKTNINENYLKNLYVVQATTSNLCNDKLPGFCINGTANWTTPYIRNYLNPITKTRPNINEITPSILIQFATS